VAQFRVEPDVVRLRIRRLRRERGLTQEAVAQLCGINEKHYQDLETGRKPFNPTLETLNSLAVALETPLHLLVAESSETQQHEI
jgi:transcriptional regulator with XRE-family HTH domain